jgi:hypothetical protein
MPANRRILSLAERRADLKSMKNARKEGITAEIKGGFNSFNR